MARPECKFNLKECLALSYISNCINPLKFFTWVSRIQVSEYVKKKIEALRLQNPGHYQNVACIRGNAMKHLPNFFQKGQV